MTVASPSVFPGSRTLASWWRQLAPLHPRALWVAHLALHRVEALVRLNRTVHLDRFARMVLEALVLRPASSLDDLETHLHLGRLIIRHMLQQLQTNSLTQADAAGCWRLTARGEHARRHGEYHDPSQERRVFYFLDNGRVDCTPEFVNLNPAGAVLEPVAENRPFDVSLLAHCLSQAAEWKTRHGFPLEVEAILPPSFSSDADTDADWQRVILVRPEHLLAALVRVRSERKEERIVGFAIQPKGWHVSPAPTLELDPIHSALAPELKSDLSLEAWRHAWIVWGQAHGLTTAEIGACHLERRDHRLVVSAARPMVDRLRASRGEKGEAWILAGEGNIRPAALLDMVASGPKRS
jgi:hypothetical protein